MAAFPRLAVDAWPCRCGRPSDGETQCSKVRLDEVQDGPSLRSQATTGPCGLSSAGAKGGHPLSVPLSGVPPSASTRTDQADPFLSGLRIGRAKETSGPANFAYTGRGARTDGLTGDRRPLERSLPPSLPAWHSSRWSCSTILRSGSRFLPPAWPCPMPPDLPLAHVL
jgi:hypothetical protein